MGYPFSTHSQVELGKRDRGLSGGHAADGEGRVAARSALWEVAGGGIEPRWGWNPGTVSVALKL